MKCDELKVHKAYNRWIDEEKPTPNDDLICNEVYLKDEVNAAIAELYNRWIDEEKPTPNDDLICNEVYLKDEVDAAIAELKQKLEDAKATAYAESVDAGMENRRLKRALWLERAEMARTSAWVFWDRKDDYNYNKWKNVERKCRAKAKEYK